MLDIADQLSRWCEQGRTFAVATVVAVHGSALRQPGAALAVDVDGAVIGSVSGGCVEAAVYDLCREALASAACTIQHCGYSDEDAFAVLTAPAASGTDLDRARAPCLQDHSGLGTRRRLQGRIAEAARVRAVCPYEQRPTHQVGRPADDPGHCHSICRSCGGGEAPADGRHDLRHRPGQGGRVIASRRTTTMAMSSLAPLVRSRPARRASARCSAPNPVQVASVSVRRVRPV